MKRTIYDNYDLWENYPDEEMQELALVNGLIEEGETASDNLIWELRCEEDSLQWDETKEELTRFFNGKTVIFYGTIGTWRGAFAGGQVGEFWELFYKAVRDCDYISLTDENGSLFLKCSHHDGTNNFRIKVLTDAGIEYFERWNYSTDSRTERHAHEQIVKRYSRRPNYFKTVYGC